MGLHNLPASYDTWRLSGPEDHAPRRKVSAAEFSRGIELPELNDLEIDCAFSVSDGDCVTLESVTIHGKAFTAEAIREWFGTATVETLEAEGQSYWIEEGWAEAERDHEDERADYLRDRYADH